MNERKTLKSGNVVLLQMASFAVSMKLLKVVVNEVKQVDVGDALKLGGEMKIENLAGMDLPVDALKNLVCQLLGSDALEMAIRDCMKGCQYNGEAIKPDTFEDENARADYLPVAWEVIQLNLGPFFKGLSFKSSEIKPPVIAGP